MREGLRVSITLSGLARLYGDRLAAVAELGPQAEAAGIDQIAVPDHLAIGPRTDKYPYGRFPLPPDEPWLEPLTLLAVLAGATRRIRLATGVLIAPLRPALLLAKTAATLDVLSGGRLDLGVGLGWQREEFTETGAPFEQRAERMGDALRACRALWSGERVSFRSATVSFDDLICRPRPLQPGGPPLWFGVAATEANAARIAELGAGWLPMASDPEAIAPDVARLRRAFEKAGRDPSELGVRANAPVATTAAGKPDLDATLKQLPRLREAGVTIAGFALARFVRSREEIGGFLKRLGSADR
jgi:probable F420-dependent oxidoreductase